MSLKRKTDPLQDYAIANPPKRTQECAHDSTKALQHGACIESMSAILECPAIADAYAIPDPTGLPHRDETDRQSSTSDRLRDINSLCQQIDELEALNAEAKKDVERCEQRRRQSTKALGSMVQQRNELERGIENTRISLQRDEDMQRKALRDIEQNKQTVSELMAKIGRLSAVD